METETTTFTIEGLPDYDNGTANVHIGWADDAVDWDVFVENAAGETSGPLPRSITPKWSSSSTR